MKYSKIPLSIPQQADKLESRGLIIDDRGLMIDFLSKISYYRMRAYTYPFQENKNPEADHCFIKGDIHLSDIIHLYDFDKCLRGILFKAIEEIEIALRAKIIQVYSENYGSHWFLNRALFKNEELYKSDKGDILQYDFLEMSIKREIDRSSEDFIKHYKNKYGDPELPPAWMTLEVLSLGTLSKLYDQLLKSKLKDTVSIDFGLPNSDILANWLHAFSVLRNFCAHHSRVWNRRFITHIILPYNTIYPFMDRDIINKIHNNKLFALLSCVKYALDVIHINNALKIDLQYMLENRGRLLNLKDMGFPYNWERLPVWNDK
jgi:abortive infection bacteriophage resistance protein